MGKIFTRKELERLNVSEENINLVLNYQKKLPVLIENNEIGGFCIDVRILYQQIFQTDDMTHFSRWFNRAIKNYRFDENVDFTSISPIGRNVDFTLAGDIKSIERWCTIDMAKQLAMVSKTDIGLLARRYFITMEYIIKENKEWYEVRDPEKYQYKLMCDEIERWVQYKYGKIPSRSDYACEADMLNEIVVGMPAREIRAKYHIPFNELTRDYLKKEHNEELLFLEEQNIILLKMNLGFTERETMLYRMYNAKYGTNRVKVA